MQRLRYFPLAQLPFTRFILIEGQRRQRFAQSRTALPFKLNYPQAHAGFNKLVRQRGSDIERLRVTQLFHAHGARLVSIEREIPSRELGEKRERTVVDLLAAPSFVPLFVPTKLPRATASLRSCGIGLELLAPRNGGPLRIPSARFDSIRTEHTQLRECGNSWSAERRASSLGSALMLSMMRNESGSCLRT